MIALLAAVVLSQKSLLTTIAPHPTGQNGYEEYLAAADLVNVPEFNNYQVWLSTAPAKRSELTTDRPSDVEDSDSDLVVRNKMVAHFERSLLLLEAGNRKDVYDPRNSITPETLLPEFATFRRLAKLEAAAAHVSFAYGDTSKAINQIQQGFIFSSKISGMILISFLVGRASETIMFDELDARWPQLSISDADSLDTFLTAKLASPSALLFALKGEEKVALTTLDELLSKPEVAADYFNGEQAGMTGEIGKLNGSELKSMGSDAAGEIVKQYERLQAILSGPESGWLKAKGVDPDDQPYDPSESLGRRLAKAILPSLSQVLFVAEQQRTHERLALLSAKVIEYRWANGHLPAKVEDFTTPKERIDPSTGKPFLYKLDGDWFLIIREGTDQLGRVTSGPQHRLPGVTAPPISDGPM